MVTTVRFPNELHKIPKTEAAKRGLTLNTYLISLLWNAVECKGRGVKADGHERKNLGKVR